MLPLGRSLLCALIFCGLVAAQDDGKKKDSVPDGLKALRDPDPNVRIRAVQILGSLGKTARFAVPELREALADKDGRVRVRVVEALWKIDKTPTSTLFPVLEAALRDKDARVRALVPSVFAQFGPKAKPALPALLVALKDPDITVCMEVILALGELGPVAIDAIPLLFGLSKHADFSLLEPMISVTLGSMGPKAVAPLAEGLKAKEMPVRRMSAYALGLIAPPSKEAAAPLGTAVEDPAADVRAAAVEALGKLGPVARDALPRLSQALSDKDGVVRVQAVLAVFRVSEKVHGLPVLRAGLRDTSLGVRESACQVAALLGDKAREAVPELCDLVKKPDGRTRLLSIEALGRIGPAA